MNQSHAETASQLYRPATRKVIGIAFATIVILYAVSFGGGSEWRERYLDGQRRDQHYRVANAAQVGADVALLAQVILNLQVDVAIPPTPSIFYKSNPFGGVEPSSLSELKSSEMGQDFLWRSGLPYWDEDLPMEDNPSTYHTFEWADNFYRQVAGIETPFDFYPVDRFSPEALPYRFYIVSDDEHVYLLVLSNGPNLIPDITDDLILQVILGSKSIDDLRGHFYDPDRKDSIDGDIAVMVDRAGRPRDPPIRNPITGEALGSSAYFYDAALGRFSTWVSKE